MKTFARRIFTVLNDPRIGFEYANWCFTKHILRRQPVRNIHGISLGNFNGFSEYHSVRSGVNNAERRFIENQPLSDGVIVDVGANLGLFSLLIAKRAVNRRVYAIEPNPSTLHALQKNIERNQSDQVACFQCAIADHDGIVRFASREHARANASIAGGAQVENGSLFVPCLTLDSFCLQNGIEKISMLKVDVEGYETIVFRGATSVLNIIRPRMVFFEVCPALTRMAGYDPFEPPMILAGCGYKLNRISRGGQLTSTIPREAASVDGVENWVAVLA